MRPCGRAALASQRRPPGRKTRQPAPSRRQSAVSHRSALVRRSHHRAAAAPGRAGRVRIDVERGLGESVIRHVRLARVFRILLDGLPLIVGPRPVGDVRFRIFEDEAALVAVQIAQPPLPAIVAVLARSLDAQHFAGEGIDDHPPPIFVDVDLDVARLGKAKGRPACVCERFAKFRHDCLEPLEPWRWRPKGWRTAPER